MEIETGHCAMDIEDRLNCQASRCSDMKYFTIGFDQPCRFASTSCVQAPCLCGNSNPTLMRLGFKYRQFILKQFSKDIHEFPVCLVRGQTSTGVRTTMKSPERDYRHWKAVFRGILNIKTYGIAFRKDTMESLTVLEPEENPQKAIWYRLVPRGQCPSARVGHNCLYWSPSEKCEKGKVVIIGGANPNGSFSDAYIIDLDSHEWDEPDWENLLPRYEHANFIPTAKPDSVWVFGGAEQSGNRNCVQVLHLETGTWKSPKVSGLLPSRRTFHTSSAAIGDDLYVFGGGDKGSEPVSDTQLHIFNSVTLTWTQPEISGNPPAPRHGHVMVAVGSMIFVHGGLSGDIFFEDMFCIDTSDMKWQKLNANGDVPEGCAAHSAAVYGKHIYIFGGMGSMGALNTMYKYNTEKLSWTILKFDSPAPPARLDHSMCIIPWKVRGDLIHASGDSMYSGRVNDEDGNEVDGTTCKTDACDDKSKNTENCESEKWVKLCLIFGGMDTNGDLYNDCSVTVLEQ